MGPAQASALMPSRAPLRSTCGHPLLQSKRSVSYYAPVNQYVNRVRSSAKRTRGEVIDVLAVAYAEVRSVVRCQQVRALVDWPRDSTCGANERDCRRGQLASCDATGGECELNGYDAAPNVKHTRPIEIDGLLNLRAVRLRDVDAVRTTQPRDQRSVHRRPGGGIVFADRAGAFQDHALKLQSRDSVEYILRDLRPELQ
jgi:hypothetical protein